MLLYAKGFYRLKVLDLHRRAINPAIVIVQVHLVSISTATKTIHILPKTHGTSVTPISEQNTWAFNRLSAFGQVQCSSSILYCRVQRSSELRCALAHTSAEGDKRSPHHGPRRGPGGCPRSRNRRRQKIRFFPSKTCRKSIETG